MAESSQPSQPPRRQPRRLVHCHQSAPLAAKSEEPEAKLGSNLPEESRHSQPPLNESPQRSPPGPTATTKTPIRLASSRHSTTSALGQNAGPEASSRASRPAASYSRSHVSNVGSPAPPKQPEIEGQIDMEMHDAVFLDNNFVQNFLTGDSNELARVLDRCQNSPQYTGGWSLPKEGPESGLYEPIVAILNTIKRAVHGDDRANNNDRTNNSERANNGGQTNSASTPTWFLDNSARTIPADDADSADTKPDIVLFEGDHRHWETVKMAIEVKLKPTQLKEGMKQLSRYARAVYAHQLHRRHLYGLVICGPMATFVRFDRAGILHSPEIDMRGSFEVFTKAFASLMMLDRTAEGYDSAFSATMNDSGRLDYHVDLPESAFVRVPVEPSVAGPSGSSGSAGGAGLGPRVLPTRRFKVIERLCHRKSIRGRATIVLRIREVEESDETSDDGKGKGKGKAGVEGNKKKRKADEIDQPPRPDYILKLIWRDPYRESEGDVMKILRGMFALAQYVWHCDVAGECRCGVGGSCGTCVDETPRPEGLERSPVMGFSKASPAEGRATKSNTASEGSSGCVRTRRIYSRILMSSIGEPLWAANSVEEFLTALLDAILGYWRLVNLGILHRDISDGNVMLLRGAQPYQRRKWMEDEERKVDVKGLREEFGAMAESESKLRNVLNSLNRDPSGMVSDFDLHTKLSSVPSSSTNGVPLPRGESAQATSPLRSGVSSTLPTARNQDSELPSKKLKTNSCTSVPVTAPTQDDTANMPWLWDWPAKASPHHTPPSDKARPLVDFRTGTPTFMSVTVLRIPLGQEYTHSFMDDLESFFWLLVWSVAAHLNPTKKTASPQALNTLNKLDDNDLEHIASFKSMLFQDCTHQGGLPMATRLRSFESNAWATHPKIIWLICNMGGYFYPRVYLQSGFTHDPNVVFPELVAMISRALDLRRPE